MCLVPSVRCRPGLTHAGNISLQLLQCLSDQGAGSSLQISVKAFLTDVWKRFYCCEIFLFIVFFIVICARDIWPMIDSVGAVQGFPSQLRSSVVCGSRISFSDILLT